MRFYIPKPLHGWREFAGEVGIIVVGVLIALAAQQAVTAWQWNQDAAQANSAIQAELASNAGVYEERSLVQPCADRRLAQISNLLSRARHDRLLPDIGSIGRPPDRPTIQTAWSEAASSGALEHLSDASRTSFASLYAQTATYDDHIYAEQVLWSDLRELEHAPGPISDAILADAIATTAKLKFQSEIDGIVSAQAAAHARREKIRPNYGMVLDPQASRADLVRKLLKQSLCKPLIVDGKPLTVRDGN